MVAPKQPEEKKSTRSIDKKTLYFTHANKYGKGK